MSTPTWPASWKAPHPLERNRVADVHVGRRDVDAELDAQRPAERELALELALREDVHARSRVRLLELCGCHGGRC